MVVLVITRSSWNTDNNAGNTLSNLFSGLPDCQFHSLYFRSDPPKNDIAQSHFHITEGQLLRSLLGSGRAGRPVLPDQPRLEGLSGERLAYSFAKKWNSSALWLVREFVWVLGRWKRGPLDEYIERVNPDVVFMPAFECVYPYSVLRYVADRLSVPTVLFHADDNYSLRQARFSPLYWLSRILLRGHVRRAARSASTNYCISEEQQDEYSRGFGARCDLLSKGADFDNGKLSHTLAVEQGSSIQRADRTLRLVFTGNITSGRWETLVWIARAIDKLRLDAQLDIYSHNELTLRIRRAFDACQSLRFCGGVPSEAILSVQARADVLVHVESFRWRERLETRLSFSTKLVDYFARHKCILAIGWKRSASIAYLLRNDAALVAVTADEVEEQLPRLLADPSLVEEYAHKAWQCGRRNHSRQEVQQRLLAELQRVAQSGKPRS